MQNAVCFNDVRSPIANDSHDAALRDNLEFLQWMKRFWDSNYGGQGYDAVGRRKGAPTDPPATIAPLAPTTRSGSGNLNVGGGRAGGKTPIGGHRTGSAQPNEALQNLQAQLREMSSHLEGLEKERDFYFAKVRGSVVHLFCLGISICSTFSSGTLKYLRNNRSKHSKQLAKMTRPCEKSKRSCTRLR